MASLGVTCSILCNLTMRLSGRAMPFDQRRARGAQPPTYHGPNRWLGDCFIVLSE
jgi:hypothetical protein